MNRIKAMIIGNGNRLKTLAISAAILLIVSVTLTAFASTDLGESVSATLFAAEKNYNAAQAFAFDEANVGAYLKKAFPVTVCADGKTNEIYLLNATVADALEEAGIVMGENDTVTPALDTPLASGDEITVYRVTYKTRTANEVAQFEVESRLSLELFTDETKIIREGVNGEKTVVYNDKYIDGKLAESEIVSQTITKEPVKQIIEIGAKEKLSLINFKDGVRAISNLTLPEKYQLDENNLPVEYADVIEGKATAYCDIGTTASGVPSGVGYVAVNPKQFPYGTELYVVSLDGRYIYGYCIAADTGGFVKMGNTTIDIFLDSESMCYQWGNRPVRIYVLSYA